MRNVGTYVALLLSATLLAGCGGGSAAIRSATPTVPEQGVAALAATNAALEATIAAQRDVATTPVEETSPAPALPEIATASKTTTEVTPESTSSAEVTPETPTSTGVTPEIETAPTVESGPPEEVTPEPFQPVATSDDVAPTSSITTTENVTATADDTLPSFAPAADAVIQTVNIELIFDASGSMAADIGSETKIEAARRSMERTIDSLPDGATTLNVGFRVYGHKGNNTDAGRAESCRSTELLVPVRGVDKEALRRQTNAFQPTGWTPLTLALQKGGEDLPADPQAHNVIIMVADGLETCDGDPCATAKALRESQAEVRIDVVGFGSTSEEDASLRCIADNSGGVYTNAQDGDALVSTLDELVRASISRSTLRINAVGADGQPIEIYVTDLLKTDGGDPGTIKNAVTGGYFDAGFTGSQRIDLPPGTYRFTVQTNSASNTYQRHTTTYQAELAPGRETVALVGLGGVTFRNDGLSTAAANEIQLETARDGAWQTTVVDYAFAFDFAYDLQPGRYRLRDTKRNAVINDQIIVSPGKMITVQIGP